MADWNDLKDAPADKSGWDALPDAQPDNQATPTGEPDTHPEPFLNRVMLGKQFGRVMSKAVEGLKDGFGPESVNGISEESRQQLVDLGIFRNPDTGRPGVLDFTGQGAGITGYGEGAITLGAKAWEVLGRSINAGLHGLGNVAEQIQNEVNGDKEATEHRLKNEIINFGNWLMIEGGMGRFARPGVHESKPVSEQVGTAPKPDDFSIAAKKLGAPEERVREAWQERGIHPAELYADAQNDTFMKHQLTADAKPVEVEGMPKALGAEVTSQPPLVDIADEPARPASRLMGVNQELSAKFNDIMRDAKMLVSPMTAGTNETMAIAKDFANTLRRNRWDHDRIDTYIAKNFTDEQRYRMWNAADEESVMLQKGEKSEHMGLKTLDPKELEMVDELNQRSHNAWVRAYDVGMVTSEEGLPMYTPRMVINTSGSGMDAIRVSLNGVGQNLRTATKNMIKREYLTAEETEAAARRAFGPQAEIARDIRALPLATKRLEDAIAGRSLINEIKEYGRATGSETVAEGWNPGPQYFTLDHPSFQTQRAIPGMKTADGKQVFERVPIYVHNDFEGPLRAVLDEKSGAVYRAMMELKGKSMSLIMNSPAIHNMVEWGRAFPAMPGKMVTFKVYFDGNRAKNNVALMHDAIEHGLVPIGKRFFNQDITSIMEAPDLTPGRSWTSKVLAAVPGLFDEAAGTAVKKAVDKAGDFWHNTLLWDRIADLQMGIYTNMRENAIQRGLDPNTASYVAAHLANRYAGALPKEAMSNAAQKFANVLLFSRTFTMGNVGVLKDMFTGLPKDVLAQIERDAGFRKGSLSQEGLPNGPEVEAVQYAKSMARRKAFATVALDIALLYGATTVIQSATNVLLGDRSLSEELHGYVRRFRETMDKVYEHPMSLLQPLDLIEHTTAMADNEPKKGDRVKIGHLKDGTAVYGRAPVGKIGEEFMGYMFRPIEMLKAKMSTFARPLLEVIANDKGFGRKIYDPEAHTPAQYASSLWAIVQHFMKAQAPAGQVDALMEVLKGEQDEMTNKRLFGPLFGVTFSKGAPGGEAVGEMMQARREHDFKVQQALPDIRKMIQRGDLAGARQAMQELQIAPGLQRFYERTALNPATRMRGRALQDFYRTATPEQRERFVRQRGGFSGVGEP